MIITTIIYKNSVVIIPIVGFDRDSPIIKCEIEGYDHFFGLDLGSLDNYIDESVLTSLERTIVDQKKWKDVFGNRYESNEYIIPRIKISGFVWKKPRLIQDVKEFHKNTIISEKNSNPQRTTVGAFGRTFLNRRNLLIDCANKKLVCTNSKMILKTLGYNLSSWIVVPIELTKKGIIVRINTDFGIKKLILDSGANIIAIHDDMKDSIDWKKDEYGFLTCPTNLFEVSGYKFSRQNLYKLEFSDTFLTHADGLLGMSFLEDYEFYIDYENELLYINPVMSNVNGVRYSL